MTYDDILEAARTLEDHQTGLCKQVFVLFEGADYDRGDKIIVSKKMPIPDFIKHRLVFSPHLEPGTFCIIQGEQEPPERVRFITQYDILLKPQSLIVSSGV